MSTIGQIAHEAFGEVAEAGKNNPFWPPWSDLTRATKEAWEEEAMAAAAAWCLK